MSRILRLSVACLLVATFACYHATVETGLTPSNEVVEKSFAAGWIFGLVPPSTVHTASQCTHGAAKIETQLSFVNQLVAFLTDEHQSDVRSGWASVPLAEHPGDRCRRRPHGGAASECDRSCGRYVAPHGRTSVRRILGGRAAAYGTRGASRRCAPRRWRTTEPLRPRLFPNTRKSYEKGVARSPYRRGRRRAARLEKGRVAERRPVGVPHVVH